MRSNSLTAFLAGERRDEDRHDPVADELVEDRLVPEGLAGLPVLPVRRDRGIAVVGVDPARPGLRIVHELVGSISEDAADLRAHVGEATAVGDVGIGHVDVDGGRHVLHEHLEARAGLLDLAGRALERRGRAAQATHQDDAGATTTPRATTTPAAMTRAAGWPDPTLVRLMTASPARTRAPPNKPTTGRSSGMPNRRATRSTL